VAQLSLPASPTSPSSFAQNYDCDAFALPLVK